MSFLDRMISKLHVLLPTLPAIPAIMAGSPLAVFMPIPQIMLLLMVMMAIDYLTGLAAAFVRKELDSSVGFIGIVKKFMIFIMVYSAQEIGVHLTVEYRFPLDVGKMFGSIYALNEFLSITENCARAGIPVPVKIINALKKLASRWNGEERRKENKTDFIGKDRRDGGTSSEQ